MHLIVKTRVGGKLAGNDTIDRYPPACEKVEKILCVSEKVFKKIQRDFERFGIKVGNWPFRLFAICQEEVPLVVRLDGTEFFVKRLSNKSTY